VAEYDPLMILHWLENQHLWLIFSALKMPPTTATAKAKAKASALKDLLQGGCLVFCRSCFSCEQNNLCGRTRFVIPVDDTAALVVRYRGDGRSGKKPILLSAHMNVVDARPEDWQRYPFTLIEKTLNMLKKVANNEQLQWSIYDTTLESDASPLRADEFAHGLNERVPVASLPFALKMWNSVLKDLTK
jgi:acetylornithine deacetylase/succinyl-diaminopimelate desuccinylase-like protein